MALQRSFQTFRPLTIPPARCPREWRSSGRSVLHFSAFRFVFGWCVLFRHYMAASQPPAGSGRPPTKDCLIAALFEMDGRCFFVSKFENFDVVSFFFLLISAPDLCRAFSLLGRVSAFKLSAAALHTSPPLLFIAVPSVAGGLERVFPLAPPCVFFSPFFSSCQDSPPPLYSTPPEQKWAFSC